MTAAAKRILLATIGSLGDLHPMLALALELQRRGHSVTVASAEFYRARVEALGISFRSLRPNWNPTDVELIAQCEDLRRGPEVLFRKLVLPHLPGMYEDLAAAADVADLMIVGELVFAAPLLSEKTGLPWISAILSPISFLSAHDPSLLVNAPRAYALRRAGWLVNRAFLNLGRLAAWPWWRPVRQLRRELGLPVASDPVFRDKLSPYLVLALFSPALGQSQPDWPRNVLQPGFVFFDQGERPGEIPELREFLAAGDAPIVFTLGSTAVHNAGNFFAAGAAAARQLGRRALLVGANPTEFAGEEGILAIHYAPYSQVFPFAAAIVHQGGSGTTAQALRAGRPQLIVPYGWDQPDNGARIERLGVGLSLERVRCHAKSVAAALRRLLEEGPFAERAAEIAPRIRPETALREACDAVEAVRRPR